MKKCIRTAALLLAALGGPLEAQPLRSLSPPPPAAPNLLAEAARSVGIKQCHAAVARLSTLALMGSKEHDVLLDWDKSKPDEGPVFSLLGVSYGAQSAAATITVVPHANGECTVAAERISVAPFTCQSIAQVELKSYRVTALLPNFHVYTLATDPGASVSLIDSPPTCLVIRRHVQYRWKEDARPMAPVPATSGPAPAR